MARISAMPGLKRKAADDLIRPDFHHVNVDVEGWLKSEKGLKLDSGEWRSLWRNPHASFELW